MGRQVGVQWSNLPDDLLPHIHRRLSGSHTAAVRFRSVCRSWRDSVPSPTVCPNTIPSCPIETKQISFTGLLRRVSFSIHKPAEEEISGSSSSPQLVLVQAVAGQGGGEKLRIPIPLSQWLFSEYRAFHPQVRKTLILCHSDKFVVVSLSLYGELHYWIEGDENWTWIWPPASGYGSYRDITIRRGKIYMCDRWGTGYSIEIRPNVASGLKPTKLTASVRYEGSKNWLVISDDDGIYLVDRHLNQDLMWRSNNWNHEGGVNVVLRVYRMNEDEHDWDEVSEIGERVLILIGDSAFMVSGKDQLAGLGKSNCIYYGGNALLTSTTSPLPTTQLLSNFRVYDLKTRSWSVAS